MKKKLTLEEIISAVAILASLVMKEGSTSLLSNARTPNAITWKTPAMFPKRLTIHNHKPIHIQVKNGEEPNSNNSIPKTNK